jgi:hypothetical protein
MEAVRPHFLLTPANLRLTHCSVQMLQKGADFFAIEYVAEDLES